MFPQGEQFDELLSGYIDGELTPEERQRVEQAAQHDALVEKRIADLRRQSAEVGAVGRKLVAEFKRPERLTKGNLFAAAVIAKSRQQAIELGLSEDHYLFGKQSTVISENSFAETLRNSPDSPDGLQREPAHATRWRSRQAWLVGVAATSAAVLSIIGVWRSNDGNAPLQLAQPQSEVVIADANGSALELEGDATTPVDPILPASDVPAEPGQWVGQFGPLTYVMVVDVQVSAEALRERRLEMIFSAAGIARAEPIQADSKILKALDDSRMIVDPANNASEQIFLTVIRADMRDIDTALQNVWKDERSFPKVGLNMAIDARAALTREILNGAAGRLPQNESLAIPVTTSSGSLRLAATSPSPDSEEPVTYFSSARRAAGWEQADALATSNSEAMATILLVMHLVD